MGVNLDLSFLGIGCDSGQSCVLLNVPKQASDGNLQMSDTSEGQHESQSCTLIGALACSSMGFIHGLPVALTGSRAGKLRMHSLYTGKAIVSYMGVSCETTIWSIDTPQPNSQLPSGLFASSSSDGYIRVWRTDVPCPVSCFTSESFSRGFPGATGVRFIGDSHMIVGHSDEAALIWDLRNLSEPVFELADSKSCTWVDGLSSTSIAVVADGGHAVRVYDTRASIDSILSPVVTHTSKDESSRAEDDDGSSSRTVLGALFVDRDVQSQAAPLSPSHGYTASSTSLLTLDSSCRITMYDSGRIPAEPDMEMFPRDAFMPFGMSRVACPGPSDGSVAHHGAAVAVFGAYS